MKASSAASGKRKHPGVRVPLPAELRRPVPEGLLQEALKDEDKADGRLLDELLSKGLQLLAEAYSCVRADGSPDLRLLVIELAIDLRIPAFASLDHARPSGRPRRWNGDAYVDLYRAVQVHRRLGATVEEACIKLAGSRHYPGIKPETLLRRYNSFLPRAAELKRHLGMDLDALVDEVFRERSLREMTKSQGRRRSHGRLKQGKGVRPRI